MKRMVAYILRVVRHQQGVALIEFVLIFPIFFLLLFGGIEMTRLLLIQQRLERAGYVIADITTQYLPATQDKLGGEINETQLNNNVFPQLSRIMNPYAAKTSQDANKARQAIIITSVKKQDGQPHIQWQIASKEDTLNGCDSATPPNCAISAVNGLAPNRISAAVRDTIASFPAEMNAIVQTMPDGSNFIVSEVFYFYQPILGNELQRMSNSGTGPTSFRFFLSPRIYVKRTFFVPRNGEMLYLPDSFPAS